MQIRVRGIDADGEPQDMTMDAGDVPALACWKYALLTDADGERAGELAFSATERRRTWR
jgi:hypothetical protein